MNRNLRQLSQKKYDLVIVGGGIYGAALAWEAASRGLAVALVEKTDYAAGTSGNSLKIIHGGLRYLQQLDFPRMLESIRERKILMRIAPHLVHPLPCIMPTYRPLMKSRAVMRAGLWVNDIISFRRNAGMGEEKFLPNGRVLDRAECHEIVPFLDSQSFTGAALWTDAQAYNTERLVLAFCKSADRADADVANYIMMTDFLMNDHRVMGIKAVDQLSGDSFDIRASLTVTTAGPWTNEVLDNGGLDRKRNRFILSKAMNLVIKRPLAHHHAFALTSRIEYKNGVSYARSKPRQLFFTPWRGMTVTGTTHLPFDGTATDFRINDSDVQNFLDEINALLPGIGLQRDEVSFIHGGVLPLASQPQPDRDVALLRHFRIDDHSRSGIKGLMSVVGVKYTTARDVACRVADMIVRKLGRGNKKSCSDITPLCGGNLDSFTDQLNQFVQRKPFNLSQDVLRQLLSNYGSELHLVLKYCEKDAALCDPVGPGYSTIKAEIVHAVREESAIHLADVLLRRTELASAGCPEDPVLQTCAQLMSTVLAWDAGKITEEIQAVKKKYFAQQS
jgi:glycerol-3-phosphate dehydrogenase